MEFNFIHHDFIGSPDIEIFFGPILPEDKFEGLLVRDTMAHLLCYAGIFKSVSQARKAGWDKPVPYGFTDIRVGKLKTRITILNIW